MLIQTLRFASALSIAIAAPLAAQISPVDPQVAQLRDDALEKDSYAWNIVEGLTTEIGARPGGTEAEARARSWSVAKLKGMGFNNVRVEDYRMPVWVRGAESAQILSPFPQAMHVMAFGSSGSTPRGGLVSTVVGYKDFASFLAAPDSEVAGKIVYISHAMEANQDGSGYGAFGPARFVGPSIAAKKGAAAVIVKSIGTDNNRLPHTGMTAKPDGVPPIPSGALSVPDAEQLERILERGRPVSMRLQLESQLLEDQPSGNVIAEVTGRDPAAKKVLVGCHIDSWDNGTGAIDDGAGCAIVAAAAKWIMDHGTPLRTIQVVFFGAEEVGIFGGADFAKRHEGTDYHVVAESDFGADRVWKVDTKLGDERKAEADQLRAALAPLGIVPGVYDRAGGADISALIAKGAPAISLNQDGTRYFDLHHTANDTLDKIDPEQLRQNVAAWVAMIGVMAGPIEPHSKK